MSTIIYLKKQNNESLKLHYLIIYRTSSVINNNLIFKNVNFTIQQSSFLIGQGNNGTGKTTLLKILVKFKNLTAGFIYIYINKNLYNITENFYHYLFFLKNGLKNKLTIKQNLIFWKDIFQLNKNYSYSKKSQLQVIKNILDTFLFSNENLLIEQLSTGQYKRLELCFLLLFFSPIWFMDEPMANFDTNSVKIFLNKMLYHQLLGGLLVIINHNQLNTYNLQNFFFINFS